MVSSVLWDMVPDSQVAPPTSYCVCPQTAQSRTTVLGTQNTAMTRDPCDCVSTQGLFAWWTPRQIDIDASAPGQVVANNNLQARAVFGNHTYPILSWSVVVSPWYVTIGQFNLLLYYVSYLLCLPRNFFHYFKKYLLCAYLFSSLGIQRRLFVPSPRSRRIQIIWYM